MYIVGAMGFCNLIWPLLLFWEKTHRKPWFFLIVCWTIIVVLWPLLLVYFLLLLFEFLPALLYHPSFSSLRASLPLPSLLCFVFLSRFVCYPLCFYVMLCFCFYCSLLRFFFFFFSFFLAVCCSLFTFW